MAISLPIPTSPSSYYSISIENQRYVFYFQWSTRGQCWYLDIQSSDGTYLSKANKLVMNKPLITMNRELGPSGQIYVLPTSDFSTATPTRNNIGIDKEYWLVYYTAEELADVASGS